MGKDTVTMAPRSERRAMLGVFRQEIAAHPQLSVGFGLFWTWVWLVFQTTFFSPAFLAQFSLPLPGWIVPLSAYAVTLLALAGLFKFRGLVPKSRVYRFLIPASMSIGVMTCGVLAVSPLADPTLDAAFACAGGLLMGAGTACLHIEWGRVLGEIGQRKTILHGIVGTLIAAALLVVLLLLPTQALWVCAFAVPPACMILLARGFPVTPQLYAHGQGAKLYVPRRFLATSFTQGLSFGIGQAVLLLGGHGEPVIVPLVASFALAAVALFFCALFFRMDFNQLIYQVGFLIMAIGYLLFALLGSEALGALLVHATGYKFVDIMMFALCAYLIKQRGLPASWVFSITTCFLLLGQIGGALIGNAVIAFSALSYIASSNLATLMVFVLLTVSLLFSDRRNMHTGWGMVRPGDSEEVPDGFAMGCALVGSRHGLTAREREVFVLLAGGSDRAAICEELTLSKETVKTHIRNIYRKMNIHSQREAMAAVETERRASGYDGDLTSDVRI